MCVCVSFLLIFSVSGFVVRMIPNFVSPILFYQCLSRDFGASLLWFDFACCAAVLVEMLARLCSCRCGYGSPLLHQSSNCMCGLRVFFFRTIFVFVIAPLFGRVSTLVRMLARSGRLAGAA